MTFSEVTTKHLQSQRLSLRRFAQAISRGVSISYGSVDHWKRGIHEPDPYKLCVLLSSTAPGDWQNTFAEEMLQAMGRNDLIRVSRNTSPESTGNHEAEPMQ